MRHRSMVREFAKSMGQDGEAPYAQVYSSPVAPEERQVLRVRLADGDYALKVDTTGPETQRLIKEYALLEEIHAHFADKPKLGSPEPVYLAENGSFFVTRYLDYQTAGGRLKDTDKDQVRRQVFRRVGSWLSALQSTRPQRKGKCRSLWMARELDGILEQGTSQADAAWLKDMRDALAMEAAEWNDIRTLRAFSHGDFHSENIILGPGMTYGLDLTEAREKLAVYDIVDFLKVDIYRKSPVEELDGAGITRMHREMFFRGYKHDVDPALVDVMLKGRMLIDFASISRNEYGARFEAQSLYAGLERRLRHAFRDV